MLLPLVLFCRCQIEHLAYNKWDVDLVVSFEQYANDFHVVQLLPLPPCAHASLKLRMVNLPIWCRLIHIILEKRPLNGCCCSCLVVNNKCMKQE